MARWPSLRVLDSLRLVTAEGATPSSMASLAQSDPRPQPTACRMPVF